MAPMRFSSSVFSFPSTHPTLRAELYIRVRVVLANGVQSLRGAGEHAPEARVDCAIERIPIQHFSQCPRRAFAGLLALRKSQGLV